MSDVSERSPSPNINFRESDVEFLQNQAKIWLEAVLGERFDEDSSLGDLLADGEILHRVSMVIRNLLRKNSHGEPASPKSLFPEAAFYGKHSGKYLPYSNVDSFLKVCQKLGLTGVDLFSPPDVVEKKDIRRVCVCIRALSKKARSRHLDVPNFDDVAHTVAMPTGLVGGLRDTLWQASGATSNSPSHYKGTESNKETPEKVLLSPSVSKKIVDSDVSIVPSAIAICSAPEISGDSGKEFGSQSCLIDGDDNTVGDTSRIAKPSNSIPASSQKILGGVVDDSTTLPVAVWDSDSLSSSREGPLLKESKKPLQCSSFQKHFDAGLSFPESEKAVSSDQALLEASLPNIVQSPDSFDPSEVVLFETSSNQGSLWKSSGTNHSLLEPPSTYLEKVDSKQAAGIESLTGVPAGNMTGQGKKDGLKCGKEGKRRVWMPVVAAAVALFGTVLMIRAREPPMYEVRKGDTLTEISRRAGKSSWEELARLNPGIRNPDLIYPSDRLRVHT